MAILDVLVELGPLKLLGLVIAGIVSWTAAASSTSLKKEADPIDDFYRIPWPRYTSFHSSMSCSSLSIWSHTTSTRLASESTLPQASVSWHACRAIRGIQTDALYALQLPTPTSG
jgi:hypothetical protein